VFVQYDIQNGQATVAGGDVGCYACLVSAECVDIPLAKRPITDHECGDLPTTTFAGNANGGGAGQQQSALCLDTLQCIMNTTCDQDSVGISFCYCGTGGGGLLNCSTNGASANGACFTQETDGFTYAPTNASSILDNYTVNSAPSGVANALISCSDTNDCPCP
jgi:hypothetical protein